MKMSNAIRHNEKTTFSGTIDTFGRIQLDIPETSALHHFVPKFVRNSGLGVGDSFPLIDTFSAREVLATVTALGDFLRTQPGTGSGYYSIEIEA